MPLKENVVDVIAFDELALMARARDAAGRLTLALGDDGGAGAFLRVRRDEDGAISFSSLATEVRGYARAGMEDAGSGTGWRNSGPQGRRLRRHRHRHLVTVRCNKIARQALP